MTDYCKDCDNEILEKDWDEGEASSCGECGDNYCKDREMNNGDVCTECGNWVCFNCSVGCEHKHCEEWGCEEHFEKVEVKNDEGVQESIYLCEQHLEEYKKKGLIIED